MVQEVLKRHGRINGVVNCVGSVVARSALATDLEELRQTIDVSDAMLAAPCCQPSFSTAATESVIQ